jgi:hypothetical protein
MTRPNVITETMDGNPCRVSFIAKGDRYGLDDCLIAKEAMVDFEFASKAQPTRWWGQGCRYTMDIVFGRSPWSSGDSFFSGRGLCLHGGSTYDPAINIGGDKLRKAMEELLLQVLNT